MASGRGRGWCFTLNNYTPAEVTKLLDQSYKYLAYGKEVGESGTPHLQGYIHFECARTFSQVRKLLGPRFHLERRKGSLRQAIDYCSKDGDFHEFGSRPSTQKEKGQAEKDRWARIMLLAQQGELATLRQEFPKESIIHGPRLLALHAPVTKPLNGELCHEWWVGSTGTGKSRLLWELYPQHYAKTLNKWWDGYAFQDVVVIEEWAPRNECTASFLKVWADRYAFTCEVKGAMLPMIRPKKLIVLSNYTIEQCFPQKEDCDPLLRRFKIINFPTGKFHAMARRDNYLRDDICAPDPSALPIPMPTVIPPAVPIQDPEITSSDAVSSSDSGYKSDTESDQLGLFNFLDPLNPWFSPSSP